MRSITRWPRIAQSLLLIILLSSCTRYTPTPQEIELAEVGPKPFDFLPRFKEAVEPTLIDPYSAVYECNEPYRGYINQPKIQGGGILYWGWWNECNYNAKNRFGGYAGKKYYRYLVKDEKLLVIQKINDWGDWEIAWKQAS